MSTVERSCGSERTTLRTFLDYQRDALIDKLDGLSEQQAAMAPTASSLSLLSLVKHSAIWERRWFQVIVAGRQFPGEWPTVSDAEHGHTDPTFQLCSGDTIESVVDDYRRQIAMSNEILDAFDLDAPCAFAALADRNLRWVAVHLIEETARHAGHADILRETIDGTRGR
jgi:Protein of unknown function (DUF664)